MMDEKKYSEKKKMNRSHAASNLNIVLSLGLGHHSSKPTDFCNTRTENTMPVRPSIAGANSKLDSRAEGQIGKSMISPS